MDIDNKNKIFLSDIFLELWQKKYYICLIVFSAGLSMAFFSLTIPNEYKSTIVLAPAEENQGGGMSALAGQFGGLASLAGINLGTNGSDKTVVALEILKSHTFLSSFLDKNNYKRDFLASNGWEREGNKLTYDPSIYDSSSGRWVREVELPYESEPSSLESYNFFKEEILIVSQDEDTGIIYVSINSYSPYLAQEVAENLIRSINSYIKERDIKETEKTIHYLENAILKTNVAEMKNVFYQLIEQQIQTKMLAETRDGYVFKVIDPALLPEEKFKPLRAIMCLLSMLVAFFLCLFVILIRFLTKKND